MRALADIESDLSLAREQLVAARHAVGYGQGDRSVQRGRIPDLEAVVARLARERDQRLAYDAGAPSPGITVPRWG